MKIILGSQSAHRKDILTKMGFNFEVMVADIDEKAIRFQDPGQLTLEIARAKAEALLPRIQEPTILITSDQVVVYNGKIREKPENDDEAREFLRSYTEAPASTVTAVVVVNTATGKRAEGVDIAHVWFDPIPEEVIEEFVRHGYASVEAGAFAIDNPLLEKYVRRIEGEEESIIGLPKKMTFELIQKVQAC